MTESAYLSDTEKDKKRHRIFIFDKMFSLILFLNLTGLFSFIAPLFCVNIVTISLALLTLNCLYITVNQRYARCLFHKKHIFYWFIFLVLWPFLATLYAPAINVRELGLQLYYFTLLLATAVYILRNGFRPFHRIVTLAVAVTIIGLILSLFTKTFFQSAASVAAHDLEYEGRAYGFFMQPNIAATNCTLLFVVWFMGLRKAGILTLFLSLFGFLVLVSLTGSRGGYIAAAAVAFLVFMNKSTRIKKPFKILITPKYIITLLLVFGFFLACIPLLLNVLTATLPKYISSFDVIARIKTLSQMKLVEKDSAGKSTVAERLHVFKDYSAMIFKHPVLGYGFGSTAFFQKKEGFYYSSHNQYLKIAFEMGLFCLGFYLLLLIFIYTDTRRKRIERFLHTNSYTQLLTVIILSGMVSHMVLDSRVLYCALGCILAVIISPQSIIVNNVIRRNAKDLQSE